MATHSSTLAWKMPWTEGWWAAIHGVAKSRTLRDFTSLSCIGKGNGTPLQGSCLENPQRQGAWWAIQSMGLKRVRYNRATKHSTAHARNWENILLMKEQVDINFGNRNKHTKNAHRF